MPELIIADRTRVQHSVAKLVHRVAAELGPALEIVGIRRRGVPLAHWVAAGLAAAAGSRPPVHELGIKRYRDDLSILHQQPKLEPGVDPELVRGRTVLLVDDVHYSGRTLLTAVQHLIDAGAARVHAAVLCLRNTAEVPMLPEFWAYRLDVGPSSIIEVRVPPFEDELSIVLRQQSEQTGRA